MWKSVICSFYTIQQHNVHRPMCTKHELNQHFYYYPKVAKIIKQYAHTQKMKQCSQQILHVHHLIIIAQPSHGYRPASHIATAASSFQSTNCGSPLFAYSIIFLLLSVGLFEFIFCVYLITNDQQQQQQQKKREKKQDATYSSWWSTRSFLGLRHRCRKMKMRHRLDIEIVNPHKLTHTHISYVSMSPSGGSTLGRVRAKEQFDWLVLHSQLLPLSPLLPIAKLDK